MTLQSRIPGSLSFPDARIETIDLLTLVKAVAATHWYGAAGLGSEV
jgi:hypothetical protein